jgi:hypothetical protein
VKDLAEVCLTSRINFQTSGFWCKRCTVQFKSPLQYVSSFRQGGIYKIGCCPIHSLQVGIIYYSSLILVGDQLDAQFLLWYVYLNPLPVSSNSVLCVSGHAACRTATNRVIIPETVLIQLSSLGWAQSCLKHVEDSNKHNIGEIVHQVGHLPELYKDARSEKYYIYIYIYIYIYYYSICLLTGKQKDYQVPVPKTDHSTYEIQKQTCSPLEAWQCCGWDNNPICPHYTMLPIT